MKKILTLIATGLFATVALTGCAAQGEEGMQPENSNGDSQFVETYMVNGTEVTCIRVSGGISCNWDAYNAAVGNQ